MSTLATHNPVASPPQRPPLPTSLIAGLPHPSNDFASTGFSLLPNNPEATQIVPASNIPTRRSFTWSMNPQAEGFRSLKQPNEEVDSIVDAVAKEGAVTSQAHTSQPLASEPAQSSTPTQPSPDPVNLNTPESQPPTSAMSPTPRFKGLIKELAEACIPNSSLPNQSSETEILLQKVLESWNQLSSNGTSARTTPKPATSPPEGTESNMIKVTLMFESLQANPVDDLLGGRKILYMPRAQLERVLGPVTTKAKVSEIRKGEVYLDEVLPTTFHAISQWLKGKAILHTIPTALRSNALFELVQMYILAARLGHRSIVHDTVNNMPLTDSPFTFLDTCAIIYIKGCAGVAFRNFFKKALPTVLNNGKFDNIEQVGSILERSPALATDFAETMLGVMKQEQDDASIASHVQYGPEPFPAFQPTPQESRWAHFCSCGLPECSCTEETASIIRPSDTHTIPRRSGYVETAPPSEVGDEPWAGPGPWRQHDESAGWDYTHHPVPSGSVYPGPALSIHDAEDQPFRPRNWSSAHLGHNHAWDKAAGENHSVIGGWAEEATQQPTGWSTVPAQNPHSSHRGHSHAQSHALVPINSTAQHAADLENRLRVVEQQLEKAKLASTSQTRHKSTKHSEDAPSAPPEPQQIAKKASAGNKVLATSKFPPAPLLHPGVPPVGMPNYVPGYGYNRYVQVGNGVVHPTGPGPYGLAGRSMIAVRNSDPWNCTLTFRAGDVIECVVPCEEGRSTVQHQPWNFAGQRMQGICRTQAGSFPADYVREMYGDSAFSGRVGTGTQPSMGVGMPQAGPPAVPAQKPAVTKEPPQTHATAATQPKNTTAANVDSTWLQAATPRGAHTPTEQNVDHATQQHQHQQTRGRRSSTVTTAIRHKHLPGCPTEMATWANCACPRPATNADQSAMNDAYLRAQQKQQKAWRGSHAYGNKDSWDIEEGEGYGGASEADSDWGQGARQW